MEQPPLDILQEWLHAVSRGAQQTQQSSSPRRHSSDTFETPCPVQGHDTPDQNTQDTYTSHYGELYLPEAGEDLWVSGHRASDTTPLNQACRYTSRRTRPRLRTYSGQETRSKPFSHHDRYASITSVASLQTLLWLTRTTFRGSSPISCTPIPTRNHGFIAFDPVHPDHVGIMVHPFPVVGCVILISLCPESQSEIAELFHEHPDPAVRKS